MISDDVLEQGLRGAAEAYPVPEHAVDELLAALAPPEPVEPRRRWRPGTGVWLSAAAAAVVGLLAVVVAFGGGSNESGGSAGKSATGKSNLSPSNGTSGSASTPALGGTSGGGTTSVTAPGRAAVGGSVAGLAGGGPRSIGDQQKTPSVVPAPGGAKIVKTGTIDLQVARGEVPHTLNQLRSIATLERGYVAESHTDSGSVAGGSVTLRVPVTAFESTVTEVGQLKAKVLSTQTSGEDVTAKYVDLQARLHSLQSTRSAFERILSRATTIGDTLAVQSRITDVQTQIEQLQGQLRVLANQTSMSTLAVTVSEKGIATVAAHPKKSSGFGHAVHLSVSRFVRGVEAIVSILGPVLLVLLLAVAAFFLCRFSWRRFRRRLV